MEEEGIIGSRKWVEVGAWGAEEEGIIGSREWVEVGAWGAEEEGIIGSREWVEVGPGERRTRRSSDHGSGSR